MYKVLYHTLSKKYTTSITKGQPPTLSVSLALTVSIKQPVRVLHSAKFQIRVYGKKIQ